MKRLQTPIRVILSLLLLYGVYTETGIWTTISFGLILMALEMVGKILERLVND